MEPQKIPRRERERLRQRQDMLATALELFSGRGYYSVSMHEIAEKAEFAIGTLYRFFKNKEDLYKALMLDQVDRFEAALNAAIEGPQDVVEKLRNYVKTKGQVFRANIAAVRLHLAETPGASFNFMAGHEHDIRERQTRFLQSLAAIFEQGMRKKQFKRIASPYHLAVGLNSLTNAFLLLWLESPEKHPYPENPDAILDLLFKGLIEG